MRATQVTQRQLQQSNVLQLDGPHSLGHDSVDLMPSNETPCPKGRPLHSERISVGYTLVALGTCLFHRFALVEPEIGVELARERHFDIVALKFGLWPVDHPDEALQPFLFQPARQRPFAAKIQQEARHMAVMT